MTCRELFDFVADYMAGDLPGTVDEAFRLHLQACPNCERYLISYQKIVKACRHAFDDEPPPRMPEELVAAILKSRQA
jgi:anti-sigma factor RsiW